METDKALALISLKKLLPTARDRKNALENAQKIAESDLIVVHQETKIIDTIAKILAADDPAVPDK
ncbi:MAG: hypothetical protein V2I97_14410 [Desulfococcaceae bacterium]|nr:hypothetical protein [Desulfococcaceae bacterium]